MRINKYTIKKGLVCLREDGITQFCIRLREKLGASKISYRKWYRRHAITHSEWEKQRQESDSWEKRPLISICVPLYQTPENYFCQMIDSVIGQSYTNWQLCLADGSKDAALMEVIRQRYPGEKRIVYRHLEENGGISGNTNQAMEMAEGEWLAFLDHDDILAPDALYEVVAAMGLVKAQASKVRIRPAQKEIEIVYTDEDKISEDLKEHFAPHFKSDYNADLLYTNNYISHFFVVNRRIRQTVGDLNPAYDGAQDYDFILRCTDAAKGIAHVPRVLYHWRTSPQSTAENPDSKGYALSAGQRVLTDFLQSKNVKAEVLPTKYFGYYRVKYPVIANERISIIIPNKDGKELLEQCIRSVEESTYPDYEVIVVENNSTSKEIFSYYEELTGQPYTGERPMEGRLPNGNRVCVVTWEGTFNYSAINNYGVSHATGSYLVLLNNDIKIITRDWLEEMLGHCQQEKTAVVGCKLFYPDDTIQHAGIGVGLGGIANNMFLGMDKRYHGYQHRANLQMDYSAVTAACMMVKKRVFEEVGGLTEELAVAYNDVDLCLKIGRAGYRIVYTPYAQAYHYESKTRGKEDTPEKQQRLQEESAYMLQNWSEIFKYGDPYYNPNFSKNSMDCTLRS